MIAHAEPASKPAPASVGALIFAGLSAVLSGIGLARFAYTPLIPPLVEAGWFDTDAAYYLGAANLAGYLVGAVATPRLAARFGARPIIRITMAAVCASFFACAAPAPFLWFFLWRVISGIGGASLMVLAAPSILARVSAPRRGRASGLIFTGVGIGAILSGTAVPLLLDIGLGATWIALGALSLALTLATWRLWPADAPDAATEADPAAPGEDAHGAGPNTLGALYAVYGLTAAALVPHMIFMVDYASRTLGYGLHAGAAIWVAFGVGAAAGPFSAGACVDRFGAATTFTTTILLVALATLVPVVTGDLAALVVSTAIAGAATPGIAPLCLARLREIEPEPVRQRFGWGRATASFALAQALTAYALSYLYSLVGSYPALFGVATALALCGLGVDRAGGALQALHARR